eukprot:scaffold94951_cov27-Tisochrysis_lutea.AAC.1
MPLQTKELRALCGLWRPWGQRWWHGLLRPPALSLGLWMGGDPLEKLPLCLVDVSVRLVEGFLACLQ